MFLKVKLVCFKFLFTCICLSLVMLACFFGLWGWLILVNEVIEWDEHLGDLNGGIFVGEFNHPKNLQETEEVIKDGCQQKGANNKFVNHNIFSFVLSVFTTKIVPLFQGGMFVCKFSQLFQCCISNLTYALLGYIEFISQFFHG